MIKVVFFDLFFTLVVPAYNQAKNENDVLGLSVAEWHNYAENRQLYIERASGLLRNEFEIIKRITSLFPMAVSDRENKEILDLRKERMKRALLNVDPVILATLRKIQRSGIRIGLISNADIIDRMYWGESPLCSLFDEAIFSCDVGFLKPEKEIYEIAMDRMNVEAKDGLFVGDGGADELLGASRVGMKTVLSEALTQYDHTRRNGFIENADYQIQAFDELLDVIL